MGTCGTRTFTWDRVIYKTLWCCWGDDISWTPGPPPGKTPIFSKSHIYSIHLRFESSPAFISRLVFGFRIPVLRIFSLFGTLLQPSTLPPHILSVPILPLHLPRRPSKSLQSLFICGWGWEAVIYSSALSSIFPTLWWRQQVPLFCSFLGSNS